MQTRYGVPVAGGEKEILGAFLDHYRRTLLEICEGLSDEDLRRSLVPSGTSILGLVKHLAWCERGWFDEAIGNQVVEYPFPEDDPEADFRVEPDETTEEILDLYRDACERSRRALEAASLDTLVQNPQRSRDYNVRWVVVHMLEETARHVGHCDILREQFDGETGFGYRDD